MGALISYLAIGINVVMTLIYTPWMVRQIGQSDYGLYTLSLSFVSLLTMDFGLSSTVSRYAAKYRAEGDQKAIDNLVGAVFKLFLIIDIIILVVAITCYFYISNIYQGLTMAEIGKLKILYIMLISFNVIALPFTTLSGVLVVYEKFIQLKLCNLFDKLFSAVVVLIVLSLKPSLFSLVGITIFSHLITIIIKLVVVKKDTPLRFTLKVSGLKSIYRKIFSFTLWTTVIAITYRLTHTVTPSILGMTNSSKEIAIYSPAVSLSTYFYTIASAINGLFLPRISLLIAQKQQEKINDLMVRVGRYQIIVLGLLFIGFIVVGKDFITLWLGEEYINSYYCTIIIMIPGFLDFTQQIANTAVVAHNKIKYQALCMSITSLIGVVFSYFLSMKNGAIGSSIAIFIATSLNVIYMNYIYKSKISIDIKRFFRECYLYIIIPMLLTIIVSRMVFSVFAEINWITLITKSIILGVIYLLLLFIFYLKTYERKNIFIKVKEIFYGKDKISRKL